MSRHITSLRSLSRAVIPSRTALRSVRGYASAGGRPEQPQGDLLWKRAAVGFGIACGAVILFEGQKRVFAESATVHCDSPPAHSRPKTKIEGNTRLVGDAPIVRRDREDGETMTRQAAERAEKAREQHPAIIHEEDDPNNPMRIRMSQYVMHLQDTIVSSLEALEASVPPTAESPSFSAPTFHRDHWLRPQGGEGSSCVLSGGRVFEKAGVNVSVVHGSLPPAAVRQMKADHKSLQVGEGQALPFFAAGISIVLHPWNPHAPTVHMNYRYFEVDKPGARPDEPPLAWWFGGGSDLTPSYLYPEDAQHFHRTLRDAAARHDERYYPAWKQWCDKYFWITHRGEARGVGGIFFDDLTSSSDIHAPADGAAQPSQDDVFALVRSMGASFLPSYLPILRRRLDTPHTDQERRWQLMRRGRYVEFNLVHDRGTKFGLMTPGARIESILMSLPETARWEYMSDMGAKGSGTREEELLDVLREPREWI